MNLSEYIGQYEKADSQKIKTFPAFFDRLTIARKFLFEKSYENKNRTIKSPFYLTDLGVRKVKSPKLYAEMITKEFDTQLPDLEKVEQELMAVDIQDLRAWMDITMLLLGDYDLVADICLKRKKQILAAKDFRLFLFAGTVLAAVNNENYHLFFENAMSLEHLDFEDRIVLEHGLLSQS